MAGFFDTLFGGGAEKEAAAKNMAALGVYNTNATNALDNGLNRSVDALRAGSGSADDFFARNYGLFGTMRDAGTGILDRGRADQLAALNQAGAAYDPLADLGTKYGGASSLLLDSLGVNGAGGNDRAKAAFQAGPGYEFTLNQGLEALNRRRAATGMLGSGNADIDALNYGTGLANQTYGDWQTRLGAFTPYEMSATQGAAAGRAGTFSNIAAMLGADTMARLGLEQGVTQGQAGANSARAANDVALGNSLAGVYTGDASNRVQLAGNNYSGTAAANNQVAAGEAAGAKNLLSAGMGLATLAAGGMGGGSFGALFGGSGGTPGFFGNLLSQNFGNGTGYETNPWSKKGFFGTNGAAWAG